MSQLAEIFDILKRLQKATTKELLNTLQRDYSESWSTKKIETKSYLKTIARKLEILVEMNLVKKERVGKENLYTIIHNYPVKSRASELINQLKDIFQQDKALFSQAQKPIEELVNEIKSPYYIRQQIEDIRSKEQIINQLEYAINERYYCTINYKEKSYYMRPLKIAEFEGIWYVLLFFEDDKSYRKFRIIDIDEINISKKKFILSDIENLKIEQWHNIWYDPNKKSLHVKLWIEKSKVKYFYQKNIFNINNYPPRVRECSDGIEYDMYITDTREVRSEIMYWQPYVVVIQEDEALGLKEELLNIIDEMKQKLLGV